MNIKQANTDILILGRREENLATQYRFPIRRWVELYGSGTFQLAVMRPNDSIPYPADISSDENFVYWTITNADTAYSGEGQCELFYYVGNVLAKSRIWATKVLESLDEADAAPPEPYVSWVDGVLSAGTSAVESAEAARQYAEAAEQAERKITEMSFEDENGRLILVYG